MIGDCTEIFVLLEIKWLLIAGGLLWRKCPWCLSWKVSSSNGSATMTPKTGSGKTTPRKRTGVNLIDWKMSWNVMLRVVNHVSAFYSGLIILVCQTGIILFGHHNMASGGEKFVRTWAILPSPGI